MRHWLRRNRATPDMPANASIAVVLRRNAGQHRPLVNRALPYIWQVFCFANSFILRL
jgi:hypothetical protein